MNARFKFKWKGRELAFLRRADALMKEHGLQGWELCDMGGAMPDAAGVCNFRDARLWFQVKGLAKQTIFNQRQTILHEIAHALRKDGKHDGRWTAKAEALGMHLGTLSLDLAVAARRDPTPEMRAAAKKAGHKLIVKMTAQIINQRTATAEEQTS